MLESRSEVNFKGQSQISGVQLSIIGVCRVHQKAITLKFGGKKDHYQSNEFNVSVYR